MLTHTTWPQPLLLEPPHPSALPGGIWDPVMGVKAVCVKLESQLEGH